jgi:hypothetical protein
MLLDLSKLGAPMKLVYQLSERVKNDSEFIEHISLVQAVTLDPSKPMVGVKGTHGLFASPEWWANIEQRKMPLFFVSGTVKRTYVAGMDGGNENTDIDLLLDDGSVRSDGIYVNDKADIKLFQVGCRVELVYALDELKYQPALDGGINYAKAALEMAVSLEPVAISKK